MAFLNNSIFDNGLNVLTNTGDSVYICSAEPTTYAEATTTYALGNKTGLILPSPSNRAGGGREVIIPEINDGAVTASGTASFFAIVDTDTSTLLATQSLTNAQPVTIGNIFTLTAATIGMNSPA